MRRFRTLRWRLTLLFVCVLTFLLILLGGVQFLVLRQSLIDSRAAVMVDDVAAARASITRLPTTLSAAAQAQRVAQLVSTISGRTVSVTVYSRTLVFLTQAGSAGPDGTPELPQTVLAQAHDAGHSDPTVLKLGSGSYLAIAFPAAPGSKTSAVVQLTTSMAPIQSVLDRDLLFLFLGGGTALVLAASTGLLLTRRALRPLARLTTTAHELSAGDLSARSQLPHRDDEVGELGRAFDDMAGSIESAFAARLESEQRTRRFIADASHELRTPVTSLKGYIDVMRRGAGRDPASLESILGSMSKEAERMRQLVLDLLTLARTDASQGTPTRVVFDLNALLNSLLDEGVPGMPPQLDRQLTGELWVEGDTQATTTIVRNLLVNACKYAPGAPQIWMSRAVDGFAEFGVHDQGPGIPEADLPHVFERFYRGEKTRAREEGGSGLGLAIVQAQAHAQRGDVRIISGEGTGTTVAVRLPLARQPLEPER